MISIKDIPERIAYLILLFLNKELSPTERKELDQWILQSEENELLFDEATNLKSKSKIKKQTRKAPPIDFKTFYRRRGIV